jgi:hypothetical protein
VRCCHDRRTDLRGKRRPVRRNAAAAPKASDQQPYLGANNREAA